MKLYIKQHLFSWGDKFSVYDVDGTVRYTVKGEVFSLGKCLHVYEGEREVAAITQQLFRLTPHFDVTVEGEIPFTVVRNFSFFRPSYSVDSLSWTVTGDFFSHDYTVQKDGVTVAEVYKEWFTLGDAYVVDTARDEEGLCVLCVALVIDAVLSANKN